TSTWASRALQRATRRVDDHYRRCTDQRTTHEHKFWTASLESRRRWSQRRPGEHPTRGLPRLWRFNATMARCRRVKLEQGPCHEWPTRNSGGTRGEHVVTLGPAQFSYLSN